MLAPRLHGRRRAGPSASGARIAGAVCCRGSSRSCSDPALERRRDCSGTREASCGGRALVPAGAPRRRPGAVSLTLVTVPVRLRPGLAAVAACRAQHESSSRSAPRLAALVPGRDRRRAGAAGAGGVGVGPDARRARPRPTPPAERGGADHAQPAQPARSTSATASRSCEEDIPGGGPPSVGDDAEPGRLSRASGPRGQSGV